MNNTSPLAQYNLYPRIPSHWFDETEQNGQDINEKMAIQNVKISVEKQSYSTDLGYPNDWATAIEESALQKQTDSTRPIKMRKENLPLP